MSELENLGEIIEKIRPDVEKRLKEEFAKRVAESLSWSLENNIREFTAGYVKEHIFPEVEKMLAENKTQIAAAIVAAVEISCKGLGEALGAQALKNLAQGYHLSEIAKRLFG